MSLVFHLPDEHRSGLALSVAALSGQASADYGGTRGNCAAEGARSLMRDQEFNM
jgi:hypothetical protein